MTRLEFERRRRGWTQVELAHVAGVANTSVSRYERGWAKPYPAEAIRLARALGITVNGLLNQVQVSPKDGAL